MKDINMKWRSLIPASEYVWFGRESSVGTKTTQATGIREQLDSDNNCVKREWGGGRKLK